MFCQKCKTPLRLDSSLNNLNPTSFKLAQDDASATLTSASLSSRPLYSPAQKELYERAAKDSPSPIFKRSVPLGRQDVEPNVQSFTDGSGKDKGAMSFVMLTDSQVTLSPQHPKNSDEEKDLKSIRRKSSGQGGNFNEENLLSHKMETTARLFEILSSRSDVDHPICSDCTEMLVEGMEKRLANVRRERDAYSEFLKNANADIPTEEELQHAQQELAMLQKEESDALTELEKLEAEKADLEDQIASLEAETRELDIQEEQFWRERNQLVNTLSDFQDEKDSANLRFEHDSRQLERLQRTNVYNDSFNISHDGVFGTINGLRLGRLSQTPVEWAEINAALGQTCLLLVTVAEKLGYTFQGFRLIPMGSTSLIEKLSGDTPSLQAGGQAKDAVRNKGKAAAAQQLPLYYSSDLPFGLSFHNRFDRAMEAFLNCIRQLGKHVERTTSQQTPSGPGPQQVHIVNGLRLPYDIEKDKINSESVKIGVGQFTVGVGVASDGGESWTKACKYLLTCCKFLLAHTSNVSGSRKGANGG